MATHDVGISNDELDKIITGSTGEATDLIRMSPDCSPPHLPKTVLGQRRYIALGREHSPLGEASLYGWSPV